MNEEQREKSIQGFLNSKERLFPKAWGWEQYESGFRQWAYQLAVLVEKENSKTEEEEDDQIFYPDLIEEHIEAEIYEGKLPSHEEMREKDPDLRGIQDRLEEEAQGLLKSKGD